MLSGVEIQGAKLAVCLICLGRRDGILGISSKKNSLVMLDSKTLWRISVESYNRSEVVLSLAWGTLW